MDNNEMDIKKMNVIKGNKINIPTMRHIQNISNTQDNNFVNNISITDSNDDEIKNNPVKINNLDVEDLDDDSVNFEVDEGKTPEILSNYGKPYPQIAAKYIQMSAKCYKHGSNKSIIYNQHECNEDDDAYNFFNDVVRDEEYLKQIEDFNKDVERFYNKTYRELAAKYNEEIPPELEEDREADELAGQYFYVYLCGVLGIKAELEPNESFKLLSQKQREVLEQELNDAILAINSDTGGVDLDGEDDDISRLQKKFNLVKGAINKDNISEIKGIKKFIENNKDKIDHAETLETLKELWQEIEEAENRYNTNLKNNTRNIPYYSNERIRKEALSKTNEYFTKKFKEIAIGKAPIKESFNKNCDTIFQNPGQLYSVLFTPITCEGKIKYVTNIIKTANCEKINSINELQDETRRPLTIEYKTKIKGNIYDWEYKMPANKLVIVGINNQKINREPTEEETKSFSAIVALPFENKELIKARENNNVNTYQECSMSYVDKNEFKDGKMIPNGRYNDWAKHVTKSENIRINDGLLENEEEQIQDDKENDDLENEEENKEKLNKKVDKLSQLKTTNKINNVNIKGIKNNNNNKGPQLNL